MIILKIFLIIILLFGNLFAENYSIIETTFQNPNNLQDNNINSYAVSGSLKSSEQFIIINLKDKKYVNSIEIAWHKNYYSKSYKILGSIDYLNWFLIKDNIKPGKFPKINNNFVNEINLKNKVAQFIKILIPQIRGTQKNTVKISKIKFNFSENLKIKLLKHSIKNIKENSADILWQTDHETLGQIRYGLNPNRITEIHTGYFFTKEHSLSLENLKKGREYYFQIINQMVDNRHITSSLNTFKTKGIPLPRLKAISIKNKTHNTVSLLIQPNIKTSIKLIYGSQSDKMNKKISINKAKSSHILKITNLYPLQKYFCKISIKDNKNNSFTTNYQFETGEYNIALNKKVEGTFKNPYIADVFQLKGNILKRVTDGSFNYKTGMAVSFDPMKSDQFVLVDLGKIQAIEKIITYWRALAYPHFYFISFSNDNIKWEKLKKVVNLKKQKSTHIKGSGIPLIIGETDIKNIKTRYVKIFIPKGTPYYKKYSQYNFLQLIELKIYGRYQQ